MRSLEDNSDRVASENMVGEVPCPEDHTNFYIYSIKNESGLAGRFGCGYICAPTPKKQLARRILAEFRAPNQIGMRTRTEYNPNWPRNAKLRKRLDIAE